MWVRGSVWPKRFEARSLAGASALLDILSHAAAASGFGEGLGAGGWGGGYPAAQPRWGAGEGRRRVNVNDVFNHAAFCRGRCA